MKTRLTVTAICALFTACLCSIPVRAADLVSVNGYRLTIPPHWKVIDRPGENVDKFLAAPVEDKFSAFATTEIHFPPSGTTSSNLKDAVDKYYPTIMVGYKMVSQREVKIDGCQALDWTIVHTGMNPPRSLRTREVAVLRNDLCYVFRFNCLDSLSSEYGPVFDNVVKSIHWTNKTRD